MSDGTDPTALDPTDATDESPGTAGEPAEAAEHPSGAAAQPRRPALSAQAASRARRIGGRPVPGRGVPTGPAGQAEAAAESSEDAGPVPAERPKRTGADHVDTVKRPRPAGPDGTAQAGADGATAGTRTGADTDADTDAERMRRELVRLRWIPALVAGAVAAVMLAGCLWQLPGAVSGKPTGPGSETRIEVLSVAKTCGAAIVSYDYRNLDASEQAGRACITGQFLSDYTHSMETTVKTLAPQTKTVQVFQDAKAGVERVSPDGKQWVVLLYGQLQVTNSSTAKTGPRLDILNVEATLDRVGGKWLVSSIQ
jgi:hypothetical protein